MKYSTTLLKNVRNIAGRKSILALLMSLLVTISASAKKKKKAEERPDAMKAGVIMKKVNGGYHFFDSTGKQITYGTLDKNDYIDLGNGYTLLKSAYCGETFGLISTIVNPQGKLIMPCNYEKIDTLGKKYFIVTLRYDAITDPKYQALYDTTGNMLIPPLYRNIKQLSDNMFEVTLNAWNNIGDMKMATDGEKKLISLKNETLMPDNYSFERILEGRYKDFVVVRKGEFIGVYYKKDKEIIPCRFRRIEAIQKAPAGSYWFKVSVWSDMRKSLWYNGKGTVITDSSLADAEIDKFCENGKSIIIYSPRHSGIQHTYGVIDTTAKVIIPAEYSALKWLPEQKLYKARKGKVPADYKWGLFSDETGAIVLPVAYDSISDFKDGLATVYQSYSKGTINSRGEIVTKAAYDFRMEYNVLIWDTEENLYRARKGTKPSEYKWGLLDEKGNIIAPFEFDTIGRFIEGSAFMCQSIYKGAINNKGQIVGRKSYNFEDSKEPTEGLMPAKYKGKWGYADSLGNIVIPFSYDKAYNFLNGIAVVKVKDKFGAIDHSNKKVVDIIYEDISSFDADGYARYKSNGKAGILHKDKGTIVPPDYETLSAYENGYATGTYHYGSNKVTIKIDKEGKKSDYKEEIEKSVALRESFTWIAEITGDPKNPHKTTPRKYVVSPTNIEMYMNNKRYYNYSILKSMHHTQEGIPGYFYYCNDDKIFFFSTDQANGNRMILEGTNKGGFKDVYFIPY